MCKVSVIIPVYDVEPYLAECLDSVLNQTLRDIEVICIDDHSPDRCGDILDEYAARDERMQVIHLTENHGQGYGRNRGMERASGKYLYFLDSDDIIEPEALEELTALADREDLDAVVFDSRVIYENENLKESFVPPLLLRKGVYNDGVYTGKDLLDAFILQNEWTCYPQRFFWRRKFIMEEGIRYPENCSHEDEFFSYAGILTAGRARYIRKQYFVLRVRSNSVMTSRPGPKNFYGYLMNFYYMIRFITERNLHTFGAEANINRIHGRMMTLYSGLKDELDPEEFFYKDPERIVYSCFLSFMKGVESAEQIDPGVLEAIRRYRIVYIYGARLTGQQFCAKLERHPDILIGGFLAQYPEDVRPALMGRKVEMLDDAEIPEDAIVVIATKMMYREEIQDILEKRHIPWVFHKKI